MAPNKKDISKIGQEAFTLLDEFHEKNTRPSVKTTNKNYFYYNQYQPQKSHIVQFKPAEERVMNSYEAVKFYGGVLVCDYSKRKPKVMTYY
ncbi:uncharacterized protein LOC125869054 [Solanum stenotomum]|uniref:uncharacterized protein LOC125869054 n=1 Tax=Solanum stenotomum TaxID=172797 RepID=UPI0020D08847|nr:uncharacterized protein LOC125869054 [Solanum stenotomum]